MRRLNCWSNLQIKDNYTHKTRTVRKTSSAYIRTPTFYSSTSNFGASVKKQKWRCVCIYAETERENRTVSRRRQISTSSAVTRRTKQGITFLLSPFNCGSFQTHPPPFLLGFQLQCVQGKYWLSHSLNFIYGRELKFFLLKFLLDLCLSLIFFRLQFKLFICMWMGA